MTKGVNKCSIARWLAVMSLLIATAGVSADAGLSDGLRPDVRLLIDISGSMKDSDPENLRAPALDLIVRLLPEGSKAGVWSFGHEVEVLVEHRVVDSSWRKEAAQAVAEIDNSGLLTNIPAALEAALYDFDRLDPTYRTSIILLTDGKVDISESPMTNAIAARALLASDAPDLGAAGIPVHTIALSDEADWAFLTSLAKATGGIAEQAQSAEKLTKLFYQSLEMVAPTSRVPISGLSFDIDPSVHEFTALIFFSDEKARIGLISPSAKRYSPAEEQAGVEWFRNRKFSLVTVTAPESGKWRLVAPAAEQTRVTVISDLQLEVDPIPHTLPAGKKAELGLRLRERGKVLTDAELLGVFSLSLEIEPPAGEKTVLDVLAKYPVPADGEFRVLIGNLDLPGRYKITARLAAKTLQRELPMYVEVLPSAANSTISTRGDTVPEQGFRAPLLSLAAIIVVVAAIVALILRRRRRKKLEVWRRRNLALNGNSGALGDGSEVASGMRGQPQSRE